jgi:hypothetical protein
MTQFVYSDAILSYVADKAVSELNKKKMQRVAALARNANVIALLDASKVSVSRFDKRAMYATEKVVKLVSAIANCSNVIEQNTFVTIKSALLCLAAKENMQRIDFDAMLTHSVKLDEKRSALVYRRVVSVADSTVSAQAQQCVDVLKTLNIIREVSKNTFAITETEFLKSCRDQLAQATA